MKSQAHKINGINEKLTNALIYGIKPKQHKEEDYQKLLKIWEHYNNNQRQCDAKKSENLNVKPLRNSLPQSTNLCEVCYEELPWRKKSCKICGAYCCDKCITRNRKLMQAAEPVPFCEKCDHEYLEAQIIWEHLQQVKIHENAFATLAHEQQMIESLLKIERHKVIEVEKESGKKNELIECGNRIIELSSENRSLKAEISEMERKIEWGTSIQKQLNKKLRRTRKAQSRSMTASMNEDSDLIAPPEVDDSEVISVQNLNQSLLNTMLEEQENRKSQYISSDGSKCTCTLM